MAVYRRKYKDRKTGEVRYGSYYFKFTVDGATHKETVKTARTKKQAEEAELRARQDVHEGVYGGRGRRMLFSQFVNEIFSPWSEQHKAPRTYYKHRIEATMLCEYFHGRTLSQISTLAVERLKRDRSATKTKRGNPRAPRTVNSELTTLSGIFTLAVTHRLARENPCGKVKYLEGGDTPERRLTQDEEDALLEWAEQEPPFLKPMLQLALWTGLRKGELIALSKSTVDFARNRLFVVNPKWRRDKRKTEGVPLGTQARELLLRLSRSATGACLFVDESGQRVTVSAVDYRFKRACRLAGVKGLRFHDLRHEFGSRLGDADVNLKKIARLMGHAATKMTERYVHPTDDGLTAAVEAAAGGRRTTIVPARFREAG
jgi:integrase